MLCCFFPEFSWNFSGEISGKIPLKTFQKHAKTPPKPPPNLLKISPNNKNESSLVRGVVGKHGNVEEHGKRGSSHIHIHINGQGFPGPGRKHVACRLGKPPPGRPLERPRPAPKSIEKSRRKLMSFWILFGRLLGPCWRPFWDLLGVEIGPSSVQEAPGSRQKPPRSLPDRPR